jgi:hypothetical protein
MCPLFSLLTAVVCVTQYYDTEQNLCHSLDLNSSDNTVYLSELSTANPADRELMTSLLASVDGEKVVRPCVGLWVFLEHYVIIYVMVDGSTTA